MIYRHKTNNKLYLRLLNLQIKLDGTWVDATLYMCLYYNRKGMLWVRVKEDFNNNFRKVKIPKQ